MSETNATYQVATRPPEKDSQLQKSEYKSIEEFQKFLNKAPDKREIKTNPYAGNSLYIPIAVIEQRLDEMYAGLWSIDGLTVEVIANSVVCILTLKVVHPVAKMMIRRSGIGAIPIQLNKGEKEMSFSTIKSDAIRKNAPAAKAQALRNAAQSLGAIFGRNLNRDDVADYNPISEQVEGIDAMLIEAKELLQTASIDTAIKQSLIKTIDTAGVSKLNSIIEYLKTNQS